MDDTHVHIARIIARINAAYRAGKISERQWYALLAAAIGEFRGTSQ